MIRQAHVKDIPELKQIWKQVFNDTETFIDRFFQNNFIPPDTLLCETEKKITSMLFRLRGEISTHTEKLPLKYIYGCATLPEYRNKGQMGNLLNTTIQEAKTEKSELILVPASKTLFSYYRKFGFSETLFITTETYPPLQTYIKTNWERYNTLSNQTVKHIQQIRNQNLKNKNAVLWPEKHIKTTLEEILADGGDILLNTNGEYALTQPKEKTIEVIETHSIYPENNTIETLRNFYQDKSLTIRQAPDNKHKIENTPFGLLLSTHTYPPPYLNLVLD